MLVGHTLLRIDPSLVCVCDQERKLLPSILQGQQDLVCV